MAYANTQVSDLIATTIQARNKVFADNVTNNNALLRALKRRGNIKTVSGGNVIFEELMYVDPAQINVNSYSGYEIINVAENSSLSAAQFNFTQYAGAITMSGLQMLQNAGEEQMIDLMTARHEVTEAELQNRIDYDLYQDGTGNAGKNITGLAAAIPDDPTTGTYGGISRGTWTFWRPQVYSGVTDGGAPVSPANIIQYMTTLALRLVRGSDKPDLWVGDSNYYGFYVNALQAIQRITSNTGSADAGAGFGPELAFFGGGMNATVVLGSGISGPVLAPGPGVPTTSGEQASTMYALNTKYIKYRPHKSRNFVPIGGERQAVNQDAIVKLIGWAGNLTCSGAQFQGKLKA